MVCKFTTLSGVSLTLGMVGILNKASRGSLEEFTSAFTTAILPGASKLLSIGDGSVCFTLQAESRSDLKELWDRYQDGSLSRSLQEFLVTDDIRQTADGEEVEVTVYIDEQEYNDACLSLFLAEKQALSKNDPAAPIKRPRRNSESVVHVKSEDNVQTLFYENLRLQEAKFYQEKIHRLEEEIKTLKRQIEEARGIAGSELTSPSKRPIKSLETEDIERRPRKRHRRNSDSNLYVNAAKGEMENREVEQHRFLERDKQEFIRQYLENIHEARSITTETSDSGIRTYGAPSEHQTEDIPEITPSLYLKDLTEKDKMEFFKRLVGDLPACKAIGRSFGFPQFYSEFDSLILIMFDSFPDTPVKMLLDVVEALQLYDLVDLLNQAMSRQHPDESLHLALTLDEISKLRNPENRPASYHSKAAVLIFTEDENAASVIQVAKFFKDLDNGSEVTILKSLFSPRIVETAHETVIRWSNCQDDFSFFAVLDFSRVIPIHFIVEELIRIPNKTKLVFGQWPRGLPQKLSETLQLTVDSWRFSSLSNFSKGLDSVFINILEKRWHTLDLVSMMRELQRSLRLLRCSVSINNSLSSLPRFIRKEPTV